MDAASVLECGIIDAGHFGGGGPAHENPEEAVAAVRDYVRGAYKGAGRSFSRRAGPPTPGALREVLATSAASCSAWDNLCRSGCKISSC